MFCNAGAARLLRGRIESDHKRRRRIPMKKKKTWREKLADDKELPKTGRLAGGMSKRWGEGTMVIPAPLEVDAIMKTIPKGRLVTVDGIRARLASKHRVTIACPLTTGIFAWIAAHAADEAEKEGRRRITPYWRVLKARGELNAKYPGGITGLKRRLAAEGHRFAQKGGRCFVADYEKSLVSA
jgi:hypothetical protein